MRLIVIRLRSLAPSLESSGGRPLLTAAALPPMTPVGYDFHPCWRDISLRQPLPSRPTVREMRLRVLRDALATGEHSGESAPVDFDAFLARKRTAKSPRRDV
jgi:hypothetical protein